MKNLLENMRKNVGTILTIMVSDVALLGGLTEEEKAILFAAGAVDEIHPARALERENLEKALVGRALDGMERAVWERPDRFDRKFLKLLLAEQKTAICADQPMWRRVRKYRRQAIRDRDATLEREALLRREAIATRAPQ
jgi:hypothetical protein